MAIFDNACINSHEFINLFELKLPDGKQLKRHLSEKSELRYWKEVVIRFLETTKALVFFEAELLEIGRDYYDSTHYEEAAIIFQINTIQYPSSYHSWLYLGKSHLAMNDYSQALTYFYEALNVKADDKLELLVAKISQKLQKGEQNERI